MKYNGVVRCDVCGNPIEMPHCRIEWVRTTGEMHICHHNCSWG